jgi:transcriptional regulator with XRE-family HTH domain
MNDREKLCQRLKFLRRFKNMSQDDVSLASGIDRSHLSQIETGKSSPTMDIIFRIAKALDVMPVELLKEGVSEPERTYNGEPYNKAD